MSSIMNPIEKFWSLVDKSGDCWMWRGYRDPGGYGLIYLGGGKSQKAHRVSWVLASGIRLEKGAVVMHKCDVPACVNPEHLALGTQADNVRDMLNKGRHHMQGRVAPPSPEAVNAVQGRIQTHCLNGHDLRDAEIRRHAAGYFRRICKQCAYARGVEYREKSKRIVAARRLAAATAGLQ